jgi:hypothetical protein
MVSKNSITIITRCHRVFYHINGSGFNILTYVLQICYFSSVHIDLCIIKWTEWEKWIQLFDFCQNMILLFRYIIFNQHCQDWAQQTRCGNWGKLLIVRQSVWLLKIITHIRSNSDSETKCMITEGHHIYTQKLW